MDVRVDGDHELRGCDRPEAEIDAIGGANHPARVQGEALTCASGARVADQVTQTPIVRVAAKCIGETRQAFSKVSIACPMKVGKGVSEGAVFAKQFAGPPQDRRKLLSPIDAVDEPPKAGPELYGASAHDSCRGLRPQRGQHPADASPGRHRISERKARCDEPRDLLIARFLVSMDEIDRVAASSRLGVATSEQGVQVFADTVHFLGVLAIFPSQLQ